MRSISLGVILVMLSLVSAVPGFAAEKLSGDVIMFHAGSLSVPLAKMEKEFEAMHPGVDIKREAGGSTKMARMISEVGKPADIMASADYVVIDKNLIPKFADFNIRFATNQLVLCYTDQSKYASEINSDNWYEIIQKPGVVWGHSDPNLDPCGYRSVMVMQLAEKFYGKEGLFDKLIKQRKKEWVRPKSVELISLLKTGNMDYAWEYLSVAVQHGLKYITLDKHINLSDYKYNNFYKQAKVTVSGKKPGSTIDRVGKSITYGITQLKDAPNKAAATAFMAYMLSPEGGLKILKEMGQPPFVPAIVPDETMIKNMPVELHKLVKVNK
ncbi:tungstate ABC transporter substrate-binding protein WtpA [Maridesulfovibrio salexigens]|uniref:Extracellular solute-binding protein family 1 n=1 Tax=Maridesulfovibrio salexigens (strain ATCC 14822 / DSM 2638 / NCIMB 8403 / VKM B-1763) TaxID=526222 RepID=C6BXG6_MARSD|nr:tungstate ABC transporter substrate-binding protein WtpA [Maridesulfovibrio salexigens]ACS80472.1 extracellular solute-binding protein family 1 [Maridesulfovibrio salexigens DSM 2638]